MPNYVYSKLQVIGNEKDINEIHDYVVNQENFIYDLLPLPKEATTLIGGMSIFATVINDGVDGYQMAVKLWGSKWVTVEDVYAKFNLQSTCNFVIDLESAWSSPIAAIKKISKIYPNLIFIMASIEEQPCFAFVSAYHNGEVIDTKDCYETFIPSVSWEENEQLADEEFNEYLEKITEKMSDKKNEYLVYFDELNLLTHENNQEIFY